MKSKLISFAAVLLVFSVGCSKQAAEPAAPAETAASEKPEAKQLSVGDSAPVWTDLIGVDDERHSLSDLADAKAVVVMFTCNHCPVAQAYQDRIIDLNADYKDKGVTLVAINVNNIEPDKLPAMKERAEEKGFEFAYLYDPSQEIGREYGAMVTPHAFLLDGERKLAYVGAIDDNMDVDKVEKTYLRDAIDAVLAGSKPEVDSTKAVGCGIKYE